MTISTSVVSLTSARSRVTCCTDSATVLNIFQLPMSSGVLISNSNANCKMQTQARAAVGCTSLHLAFWILHLFIRERGDSGQFLPAEELERRAAAGRDVRDPIGDARFRDRRNRIAAANNRRPADVRHSAGDADCALRECVNLEHAHRSVPYHRASVA